MSLWYNICRQVTGCGAVGSALPWGGRGRKFKSCHSDQKTGDVKSPVFFSFYGTFSKLEVAKSGAVRLSETRSNRPRKQGWYKIWYIDSKRTFHRSVEAMPETSGKTRIFRCFPGAEFNFQNAKRSKSENEFSDQTVLRLSRHGVVKASKLQVCTKGMGVNMASITPKPNGTYLIRISCGTDAAGKPVTKSRVFKPSKPKLTYQKLNRELDAFIKEFEDEIAEFVVQGRPDRMRFAEFTAKYLEVKKPQLSPVTYTFYEQVIREMLIPMFGTLRLRDIRTYHIQQFIQYLATERPRGDGNEGHISHRRRSNDTQQSCARS